MSGGGQSLEIRGAASIRKMTTGEVIATAAQRAIQLLRGVDCRSVKRGMACPVVVVTIRSVCRQPLEIRGAASIRKTTTGEAITAKRAIQMRGVGRAERAGMARSLLSMLLTVVAHGHRSHI